MPIEELLAMYGCGSGAASVGTSPALTQGGRAAVGGDVAPSHMSSTDPVPPLVSSNGGAAHCMDAASVEEGESWPDVHTALSQTVRLLRCKSPFFYLLKYFFLVYVLYII